MNTHIIILAQGAQTRLLNLPVAKQTLPLPACGNEAILSRTLHQLVAMSCDDNATDVMQVAVVTWPHVIEALGIDRPVVVGGRFMHTAESLTHPGNSSLKGIARYLRCHADRVDRMDRIVRAAMFCAPLPYSLVTWSTAGRACGHASRSRRSRLDRTGGAGPPSGS